MSRRPARRPTLQQVADATGFSPSTVSRALREDPRVTEATRRRIQDMAKRLGFTQNALASSLRSGRNSSLVGLLIPTFQDPFFASVAAGVQAAATDQGREVIIGCHNNSVDEQDRLVRQMVSHRVEAVIIAPAPGPPPIQLLSEAQFGTRVVSVDRPAPQLGCDSVTTDNEGGARRLAQEMLARGHRRFGVVGLDMSIWTQGIRLQTVMDTLAEAGVHLTPGAVLSADLLDGAIPVDSLDTMLTTVAPTAVIGLSVMPVVQVVDATLRLGLDVELASFDGHPLFDLLDAQIFCVEQNASDLGRAAIDMLFAPRDTDHEEPRTVVLAPEAPSQRGRRQPA